MSSAVSATLSAARRSSLGAAWWSRCRGGRRIGAGRPPTTPALRSARPTRSTGGAVVLSAVVVTAATGRDEQAECRDARHQRTTSLHRGPLVFGSRPSASPNDTGREPPQRLRHSTAPRSVMSLRARSRCAGLRSAADEGASGRDSCAAVTLVRRARARAPAATTRPRSRCSTSATTAPGTCLGVTDDLPCRGDQAAGDRLRQAALRRDLRGGAVRQGRRVPRARALETFAQQVCVREFEPYVGMRRSTRP